MSGFEFWNNFVSEIGIGIFLYIFGCMAINGHWENLRIKKHHFDKASTFYFYSLIPGVEIALLLLVATVKIYFAFTLFPLSAKVWLFTFQVAGIALPACVFCYYQQHLIDFALKSITKK
jgi:hypothetical protein